jgi:ADP-heptose:LPS heptosyltransferase
MPIAKRIVEYAWIRRLARRQAASAHRTPPAPEWILAAEPFGIGDTVCALPAARVLKAVFPRARLVFLSGRPVAALAALCPFLDEVRACPTGERALRAFHRRFRKRADACLGVLLNDGWWPSRAVLGLRPGWCCGYRDRPRLDVRYHPERRVTASWNPELDERVPPVTHLVERALRAVRPATGAAAGSLVARGVPELARPEFLPEPPPPAEWTDAPRADRVLLHAGTRGVEKRWRTERWAELARALAGSGAVVLLTGSAADRPAVLRIRELADAPGIHDASGGPLETFAALAARAGLMISPDCGPAHIASAVGCATVVLMGPSLPELSAPYWGLREVVRPPGAEARAPVPPGRRPPAEPSLGGIDTAAVLAAVRRIRERLAGTDAVPPPSVPE